MKVGKVSSCVLKIGTTDYYTIPDVAKAVGLSRQTIDRYVKDHDIDTPVRRQHGKRKVRTYNQLEFDKVVDQIKNLPVADNNRGQA